MKTTVGDPLVFFIVHGKFHVPRFVVLELRFWQTVVWERENFPPRRPFHISGLTSFFLDPDTFLLDLQFYIHYFDASRMNSQSLLVIKLNLQYTVLIMLASWTIAANYNLCYSSELCLNKDLVSNCFKKHKILFLAPKFLIRERKCTLFLLPHI